MVRILDDSGTVGELWGALYSLKLAPDQSKRPGRGDTTAAASVCRLAVPNGADPTHPIACVTLDR